MIPHTFISPFVIPNWHERPIPIITLIFGLLLVWGQGSVFALEIDQEVEMIDDAEVSLEDEGIYGIIVDNTVTIIGRRFYDAFSIAWPDYEVGKDEIFSIHEHPTARSGSRIWIEHNGTRLFEVFLSPVLANIENSARKAASSVSSRFETLQLEKLLLTNPDLAADEI